MAVLRRLDCVLADSKDDEAAEICRDDQGNPEPDSELRDKIRELPLPIPPLEEQKQIVETVEARVSRLDEMADRVTRQTALLHEYRQALITAAVTGKLDVTRDGAHTDAAMEQIAAGA